MASITRKQLEDLRAKLGATEVEGCERCKCVYVIGAPGLFAYAYRGALVRTWQGPKLTRSEKLTHEAFGLPIIQRAREGYKPPPLGHTPRPDGAMEGCRLLDVLCDNCVGHCTGGSRGSGRGYHPLSTQRATRSLLVVVLPPAAFALLLILCFWASSIVF
jgi:hypothetical protein